MRSLVIQAGRNWPSRLLLLSRGVFLLFPTLSLAFAGCASIVIHERPILDRSSEDELATRRGLPQEPLVLVQTGLTLDRQNPEWAMGSFRDAALAALPWVMEEGVSPHLDLEHAGGAQGLYRQSIEYLLVTANRRATELELPLAEVLRRAGVEIRDSLALCAAAERREVMPTRIYEVQGFHHQMGQGGIGAPVVVHATRPATPEGRSIAHASSAACSSDAHFPRELFRAATAVIRPALNPGEGTAVLELLDPALEPDLRWQPSVDSGSLPLAYDMTVPLARQFHAGNLNLVGALGVLYPSEYDGKTGIYMLDPYQPGKVPVVFVHGLMSSPEGWMNAMNELRGDPELRKHYQFWMFFYSTGNPILASASRLRRSLNEIRAELDPGARDTAFDRTILVGHSMGGLLSRLMICSSGRMAWNAVSDVPPERIQLESAARERLQQAFFFEPVPMVGRVVFISTPHRGSPLGDDLIGRTVSRLIRVPNDVTEIRKALITSNHGRLPAALRYDRYATSVAQLGLGNPTLQVLDRLPMKESVPFHSIIGHDGRRPLPAGGDGVVPYTSAHVAGALSELVITSGHSAQEKDLAIREIRRILVLQRQEDAARLKAQVDGTALPIILTRPVGPTPIRLALDPSRSGARKPASRVATTSGSEAVSVK